MKLYIVVDRQGTIMGWAGTQADARALKNELGGYEWKEKEVSTSKDELMSFLNKFAIWCNEEEGVDTTTATEAEDDDEEEEEEEDD